MSEPTKQSGEDVTPLDLLEAYLDGLLARLEREGRLKAKQQ